MRGVQRTGAAAAAARRPAPGAAVVTTTAAAATPGKKLGAEFSLSETISGLAENHDTMEELGIPSVAGEGGRKNKESGDEKSYANTAIPEQATDKPARSDEGEGEDLHSIENPGGLHAEGAGVGTGGRVNSGLPVGEVTGAVMGRQKTEYRTRVKVRPERAEENRSAAAAGKQQAAHRHLLDAEVSLGGISRLAENRDTREELGVPSFGEKGGKKSNLYEDEENCSDTDLPEQTTANPAALREGAGEDRHSVEETGGLLSKSEGGGADERGELAALRRRVIALQATASEETTKRLEAEEAALNLRDLLRTTVEFYEAQLAHFMARCPRIAKDGDNHPRGAMEKTLPLRDESSWLENSADVDLLSGYDYTTGAETVFVTTTTSTSGGGEGEREEDGELPGHPVQTGKGSTSTSTVVVCFEGEQEEMAATKIFEEEERRKAGEEQDTGVVHTNVSEEEKEEEKEEKEVVASGDGVGAVPNSVLPSESGGGISEDSGPRSTDASSGLSGKGIEVFHSSPTTVSHDHEVLGNEKRIVEGAAQQNIATERGDVLGNRSGPLQDVSFLSGNIHSEIGDGETQATKKNTAEKERYDLEECGSHKRSARSRNPLAAWSNAERSVSIHREIGAGEKQVTKKSTAEKEGHELAGCDPHKRSARPRNPLLAWSNAERSVSIHREIGDSETQATKKDTAEKARNELAGCGSHKRSVRPRNPLLAWSNAERSVSVLGGRHDALQGSPDQATSSFASTFRRTQERDTTDSEQGGGGDVTQSTPPEVFAGEGGDLVQEDSGVGANTPRPLAIGNSDKSELQSEKGTEQQRQPEDGSRLRAQRVGKLSALALVLREAEDAICAGERGGQDDRGSGGRVVDRHRAQASLSPVADGQSGRQTAEEVKAGDGDALALDMLSEAILGGDFNRDFSYKQRREAELQQGGVAFLADIAEAEDAGLIQMGEVVGRGGYGVVCELTIVERRKRAAALRYTAGRELVLKGPLQGSALDFDDSYLNEIRILQRNLAGVGGALEFLHDNGIIHADVKPANILRDKNFSRFVLTDLGVAGESGKTPAGGGTPWWMPPETTGDFHGNGPSPIDLKMLPSSDVYSLAIVAHQLLTGSVLPVTSGATIFKHRDSIPNSPSKTMVMDFRRTNRAKLQAANDDMRQEAQRIMFDIYSGHVAQECRMEDLEKTLLSPAMLPQRTEMQFPNQASKFGF
ncbi:unnamed protein product [Ectocarpus sp. 6 AP-2014]